MALKWRKWNRAVHRDFGYLFLGMTIIYALSGIALNHMKKSRKRLERVLDPLTAEYRHVFLDCPLAA